MYVYTLLHYLYVYVNIHIRIHIIYREWERTQGVFATACSGGIVKIWCMEVSTDDQAGMEDVNVDNKANILAHEGASITSLLVRVNTLPNRNSCDKDQKFKERKCLWISASGDEKGNIVISQGGWDKSKAPVRTPSDGGTEVSNSVDENYSSRKRYFRNKRKVVKAGEEGGENLYYY
jgi:hypothetical protein